MGSLRRMDGTPLDITPDLLLVPPSLEGRANALMRNEMVSSLNPDGTGYTSTSNEWRGTATPVKGAWIA